MVFSKLCIRVLINCLVYISLYNIFFRFPFLNQHLLLLRYNIFDVLLDAQISHYLDTLGKFNRTAVTELDRRTLIFGKDLINKLKYLFETNKTNNN